MLIFFLSYFLPEWSVSSELVISPPCWFWSLYYPQISSNSYSVLSIRVCVCSVVWTLWPCGSQPSRLFCPWDSPGKNIGVRCHFLLRGILLTQVFCITGGFSPMRQHTPGLNCGLCHHPLLPAKDFPAAKTSGFCWVQGAVLFFGFFLDAVCIFFFSPLIQEVLSDYHVECCAANLGRWKEEPSLDSAKSFTEHCTQTLILERAKGHV